MATSLYAESITTNIKFATKVPMLLKATSDDERPTQGYVLQEISDISKSNLPNCRSLLNFLFGRLEGKSPRVKFKVLHLMKYLVINGQSEFRSNLRGNAGAIKQTLSFRGEPDPIHGDGFNEKVRQAASDLDKLLFDVDNPEVQGMYLAMVAPNKNMEGFGNSVPPPIKKEQSLAETMKKVRDRVPGLLSLSNPRQSPVSNNDQPANTPPQPQYTPVELPDEQDDDVVAGTPYSDRTSSSKRPSEDFAKAEDELEEESHINERKLVDDVTVEDKSRSTPSKDSLRDFVDKLALSDFRVVLGLLDERLRNPSMEVQLRSLCVIEYLLRCQNHKNITRSINDCCGTINALTSNRNPSVQAKAKKIALTIASYLKHEEIVAPGPIETVTPPTYDDAKELPKIEHVADECNDKEPVVSHKNADDQSLFSGMNVSRFNSDASDKAVSSSPNTSQRLEGIQDLLGEEAESTEVQNRSSRGHRVNCESEKRTDVFDPLVQLHNTGQGVATTQDSHVDLLLGDGPGFSNGNPIDLITENTTGNSKIDTNIAATQPGQIQPHSTVAYRNMVPHHAFAQTAFQTSRVSAQNPSVYGRMVPSGDLSSSSSERRLFPKDMKPEVTGFEFIRKSSKQEAFSFVKDEMAASKTKRK